MFCTAGSRKFIHSALSTNNAATVWDRVMCGRNNCDGWILTISQNISIKKFENRKIGPAQQKLFLGIFPHFFVFSPKLKLFQNLQNFFPKTVLDTQAPFSILNVSNLKQNRLKLFFLAKYHRKSKAFLKMNSPVELDTKYQIEGQSALIASHLLLTFKIRKNTQPDEPMNRFTVKYL